MFALSAQDRRSGLGHCRAGRHRSRHWQHQRASHDWGNRALYADRYFDVVLGFIAAH